MAGLMDIHNHALFGVDDGAQTVEACMQMLQNAYSQGIRVICFTPHYNPSLFRTNPKDIAAHYEKVCTMAAHQFPDLTLMLGNEVYAYPDSASALDEGKCLPLGNGRVVLVEFSPHVGYREMKNRFLSLFAAGYAPLLAHAERYVCLFQKPDRIKELLELRVGIQINAETVLDCMHFRMYRFVHHLLARRMVQVIASDMHRIKQTNTMLRAYRKITKRYGEAYAKQLFYKNPKRILLPRQGEEQQNG